MLGNVDWLWNGVSKGVRSLSITPAQMMVMRVLDERRVSMALTTPA